MWESMADLYPSKVYRKVRVCQLFTLSGRCKRDKKILLR
ncbi:hypothetical protein R70199_08062 [Paraburkholderia domus]|nr:hypothetical protein R70199_08062 [Paraburkholderia domus]